MTSDRESEVVDLCFPIAGSSVPIDHGYALYSALCRVAPELHGVPWLGVHPLSGPVEADRIGFGPNATVNLRLPAAELRSALPLAGARLSVSGSDLKLGSPTIRPLQPRATLDARAVLLKLTKPPTKTSAEHARNVLDNDELASRYDSELRRQLAALNINSPPLLAGRRTITIHGKRLVAFSVRVAELDADASLRLQKRGLGGRRAMGCGIFRPTRGR